MSKKTINVVCGLVLVCGSVAALYEVAFDTKAKVEASASGVQSNPAPMTMQDIRNRVAQDAIKQYVIAYNAGTRIDRCVAAGMVSAAFLQAQDEDQYKFWVGKQKKDCR